VAAVDKALQVLSALSPAGPQGLSLGDLTGRVGASKASVFRALAALKYRGFVTQEEGTGNYCIGPAALLLADAYLAEENLRTIMHQPLQDLCVHVQELCHLGILDGDVVVYVDKVEPERAIRVFSTIGARNPSLTTALGRAILSQVYDNSEDFTARVTLDMPMRTPHTTRTAAGLWRILEQARERGYAVEEEENEIGVCCVAVAILRREAPVAAVSVTSPTERFSSSEVEDRVHAIHSLIGPRLPVGLRLAESA
jgi:DNA-binding IclR family transcriptional regulator